MLDFYSLLFKIEILASLIMSLNLDMLQPVPGASSSHIVPTDMENPQG